MTTDKWNDGKCNTCNRPIASDGDDGMAMGSECVYPNGKSCRAFAEKNRAKKKDEQ